MFLFVPIEKKTQQKDCMLANSVHFNFSSEKFFFSSHSLKKKKPEQKNNKILLTEKSLCLVDLTPATCSTH